MILEDIKSKTIEELKAEFLAQEFKKYQAEQVFAWLGRGITNFDEMTDISKNLREKLKNTYFICKAEVESKLQSKLDETAKYLLKLPDGELVESVLMKYHHGFTICISSQIGCKMGCNFCATGESGFSRNLSSSEMLAQIEAIQKDSGEKVSNIVIMGMGEPLDNFENLLKFLELVNSPKGLNIGMRHISISTCGLVDKIYKLAEIKPQATLSVSLHAPNDEIRRKIMKIATRWSIKELIDACRHYILQTKRRISFEYALIKNINDSAACAKELANLLKGMICHVNLIPVNETPGEKFQKSDLSKIFAFRDILMKEGINTTIRRTLGSDIEASCGQLRRRKLADKINIL